jgi:hypothetical protein
VYAERRAAELIGSENAFARQVRKRGARPAFLDALNSNSVLFSGNQPVNGYQLWLEEQPDFYVRTWRYTGTEWQLTAELLHHH